MSRTELREHIFKILFRVGFHDEKEMSEQEQLYFSVPSSDKEEPLKEASTEEQEYILTKYRAIVEKLPEIDELLNALSTGWKTSRMNRVDLTILRLATYEIKWDADIPTGVAINEAVELAKKYSSDSGPAFVNGVLAKLAN